MKATDNLSEEDRKLGEYIRNLFDDAYTYHIEAFSRMDDMQRAYECRLPENWATYSQLYLPYIRTAVEQALPNVMNYLFPKTGLVSLTPTKEPMPYEQVQPVSDYINDLILNKIGLKEEGLLTLKDAMKFNVGYGIVETELVTPIDIATNTIFGAEEGPIIVQKSTLGSPTESIQYRYVNWRRIVPMPDGDKPENTSCVFHMDDMHEDTFKAMFKRDEQQETRVLKGDPSKIIEYVRNQSFSANHFPIAWIMAQFAAGDRSNPLRNMNQANQMNKKTVHKDSPVSVPILKCYFRQEHIWMTPDGTIIKQIKDEVQTLRNPIIKACPVPDGGSWFPKGDAEAGRDAADGANLFKNALLDLLTYTLHPTTLINRQAIPNGNASLEPHGKIYVNGKIGEAVDFVRPPPMEQGMLGFGQDLENQYAVANGQPMSLQGQGTAGMVRGGSGAFESLLNTTMARPKLAGAVLQCGWLQPVVEHVLIMVQIVGEGGSFITTDDTNKSFVQQTVTSKDLMHSFKATINLDDKFQQTPSDKAMDMALYRDVIKGNPRFDWTAADEWIIGDAETAKRLRAAPQVREAQTKQLQEQAQAEQAAKQGGGLSPGDQSMQGGASQQGGV